MKVMYPALFEKEDSRYNVTFPDLPEAITCGDTLEQAIEMAKECLGLCLDVRKENKEEIPVMSDPSRINCANGTFVMLSFVAGWRSRASLSSSTMSESPVSYTHLDVYKRQIYNTSLTNMLIYTVHVEYLPYHLPLFELAISEIER